MRERKKRNAISPACLCFFSWCFVKTLKAFKCLLVFTFSLSLHVTAKGFAGINTKATYFLSFPF